MPQSNATRDRIWQIDADPFDVDDAENLMAALGEAAMILTRIGGAITVLADRQEVAPGHYETTRYLFRWNSYVPARRLESEPEQEPDAAAVA